MVLFAGQESAVACSPAPEDGTPEERVAVWISAPSSVREPIPEGFRAFPASGARSGDNSGPGPGRLGRQRRPRDGVRTRRPALPQGRAAWLGDYQIGAGTHNFEMDLMPGEGEARRAG